MPGRVLATSPMASARKAQRAWTRAIRPTAWGSAGNAMTSGPSVRRGLMSTTAALAASVSNENSSEALGPTGRLLIPIVVPRRRIHSPSRPA
jgi:hypothetical protein